MTTSRWPEGMARAILAIFKDKSVQAGGILTASDVCTKFLTNGGRVADYLAGVKYALDHGWIEQSSTKFKLTDAGFAES
jgi:membrane protease subunit (stomatin/prohibitin family)